MKKLLCATALLLASTLASAASTFTLTPTGSGWASEEGNGYDAGTYAGNTGTYSLLSSLSQLFTFTLIDTTDDLEPVTYTLTGSGLPGGSYSYTLTDTNTTPAPSFSLALEQGVNYILTIASPSSHATYSHISAVPLPGAALLFGSVIAGAAALRKRRPQQAAC